MSQKKKNREGDETHIQRFSFCLGFGRAEFVLRSLDFFFLTASLERMTSV